MKKIFIVLMCLFSVSSFAEPLKGTPSSTQCTPVSNWNPVTDNAAFCQQFAASAYCGCAEKGYSMAYCQHLTVMGIYTAMIATYGSEAAACQKSQTLVSPDVCQAQWDYYKSLNAAFTAANHCN